MRGVRATGLAAAACLLALGMSGCAILPLKPAPIPPITDTEPVGAAPAGETFGTQVSLGTALPTDSITTARRAQYVAARTAAVTHLLDQRQAAVLHHDRTAFLATVDPTDPRWVAAQSQVYANLVQIPFASYALKPLGNGGLTPPAARIRGGVDVFLPVVDESYQLKGFDTGLIGRTYAMTMVRRANGWRIASLSDYTANPAVQDPWDAGAITVDTQGTVLLVGNGLTRQERSAVLTLATQAVADDRNVLTSWGGRVVLYVGRDSTLFDRLFDDGVSHEPGAYAGVEVPQFGTATSGSGSDDVLVGTRVLINPDDLSSLGDTSRASREAVILRHEFTHVALAPMIGPARPLWLTEGIAQWVAYEPFPLSAPAALHDRRSALGTSTPPHIPTDDDFQTGTDADLDDAYTDAWLVCQDIVDHEGAAALLKTYEAVSALPASDDGDAAAIDQAVGGVLHLSVAQLQERYLAAVAAS